MKQTIAEQRNIEILPGFSPKPLADDEPIPLESPSGSWEPDTHSPDGNGGEGPVVQPRLAALAPSDVVIQDGIVSFGK